MDIDEDSPEPGHSMSCSGRVLNTKKRKQPDPDELLEKPGPLTEEPIDNEYEHLDDDEDADDDQANLRKADYDQILRAQEPSTIAQYDNIKITPFNLEEELEEGEFDAAGNFIFSRQKETDEDKNDTWAESIDWSTVERQQQERKQKLAEQKSKPIQTGISDETVTMLVKDKISCYKAMLRIMRPDETVQRAIRRLGNSIPKKRPSNRNAKPSSGPDETNPGELEKITLARRQLDLMIECAHHRLEDGDMDIYQKSYEDLEEAIN